MMPSPRPPNPTRTLVTNTLLTVYFLLLLLLLPLATTAAAPTDPFLLGPWLNTGEYPTDVDTPAKWNQRLGFPAPAFQLRMSVPAWKGEPTVLQVEDWDDGTGAAVFMTVYADSPAYVWPTDDDLTAMATKLRNITDKMGRAVFLRYLPEMNGVWMTYGLQPAKFVENWKNMTAVVRRVAPAVQIVWSPNFDLDPAAGGANYWPGADSVDWVGISHYWKSSLMGYPGNVPVAAGDFSGAIDYVYKTFAVAYNKPFVLSEASYGWEEPLKGGAFKDTVAEPEAQKSYWTQVIDAATSGSHPLFRMAFVFEYKKMEDDLYRDFRVSWDPAVLAAFNATIQPLAAANRLATAGPPAAASATATTTPPTTTQTGSAASSSVSGTVGTGVSTRSGAGRGVVWMEGVRSAVAVVAVAAAVAVGLGWCG